MVQMWKIIRKVERVSFTGDYLGIFLQYTMNHENWSQSMQCLKWE